MPAFLAPLISKIGIYAVLSAVLVGGWLYIGRLRAENETQAVSISTLRTTNQADQAAMAAYQAQAQKWNAAMDVLNTQTLATTGSTDQIIDTINDTPPSADAPVAPVLANALAQIAKLQDRQK